MSMLGSFTAISICLVPLTFGLLYPGWKLMRWTWLTLSKQVPSEYAALTSKSLCLAVVAAFIVLTAGLLLAATARYRRSQILTAVFRLATLGYAMPGAVVAVGIMILLGHIDHWTGAILLLSGTIAAVIFAYLTRYLAVTYQPIRTGMERVCGHLDEASRVLGRGRSATLFQVTLPLLKRPLLAAGILVFVDILKELPLTMILRPSNFETLATKAFSLASEGRYPESALASLTIVGVGIAALIPLNRWMRGENA